MEAMDSDKLDNPVDKEVIEIKSAEIGVNLLKSSTVETNAISIPEVVDGEEIVKGGDEDVISISNNDDIQEVKLKIVDKHDIVTNIIKINHKTDEEVKQVSSDESFESITGTHRTYEEPKQVSSNVSYEPITDTHKTDEELKPFSSDESFESITGTHKTYEEAKQVSSDESYDPITGTRRTCGESKQVLSDESFESITGTHKTDEEPKQVSSDESHDPITGTRRTCGEPKQVSSDESFESITGTHKTDEEPKQVSSDESYDPITGTHRTCEEPKQVSSDESFELITGTHKTDEEPKQVSSDESSDPITGTRRTCGEPKQASRDVTYEPITDSHKTDEEDPKQVNSGASYESCTDTDEDEPKQVSCYVSSESITDMHNDVTSELIIGTHKTDEEKLKDASDDITSKLMTGTESTKDSNTDRNNEGVEPDNELSGVNTAEPNGSKTNEENNIALDTSENVISTSIISNSISQHSIDNVESSVSNLSHQLDNMKMVEPTPSNEKVVISKTEDDDTITDLLENVKISDSDENFCETENLSDGKKELKKDEISRSENEEGDTELNERECGDGEQDGKKKIDNDEDKRNPEFIPRKGTFYEHDTRTSDSYTSDKEQPPKPERIKSKFEEKGKKHSSEGKWGHDLYNELDQSPKTTQELIDTYGYDIRNEDHPPKSRRPRRYGRGPSKYERSWEDQNAYTKQHENRTPRRPRNEPTPNRNFVQERSPRPEVQRDERAEFPPLIRNKETFKEDMVTFPDRIGMRCEKGGQITPPPPPFSQKNIVQKNYAKSPSLQYNSISNNNNVTNQIDNKSNTSKDGSDFDTGRPRLGPVIQCIDREAHSKQESVHKKEFSPGFRPRQGQVPHQNIDSNVSYRQGKGWNENENGVRNRGTWINNIKSNQEPNEFHIGSSKLRMEGVGGPGSNNPLVRISGQKGEEQHVSEMSGSALGGKRYSVQRQRSIPELNKTPAYPPNSPPVALSTTLPLGMQGLPLAGPNDLPDQTVPFYHQPTGANAPLHPVRQPTLNNEQIFHTNAYPPQAPVYQEPAQNIPNGSAPPMLMPLHYVSPPPSQVPAFNTTQAPIMNYGPPPQPPMQYQPMVNIPPPPQPEIFQPPGGITYYSPQTQAVVHRAAPPRRIKTAIPIVPPNEVRMRHPHQSQQSYMMDNK